MNNNQMDLVIRTDASEQIGSGHVMRCLTLAEKVRLSGGDVTFICRELPGNRCDFIESRQFSLHRLPYESGSQSDSQELEHSEWLTVTQNRDAIQSLASIEAGGSEPDWLLVDHYALDYNWERKLRPVVSNIMVIDDLADRRHDCDLLLDQNLQRSMNERYVDLVPDSCRVLPGPEYALLRPEFEIANGSRARRDGTINSILVFMGGYDLSNETGKALKALLSLKLENVVIDLVVGAANKNREELKAICQTYKQVNYHCQVENIASLMSMADLAIGGGGTTTWERAFLGLPSIVIVMAKNQEDVAQVVADQGATINLGWHEDVTEEDIARTVKTLVADRQRVAQMSRQAEALFGERQVSGVAAVMSEMSLIRSGISGGVGNRCTKRIL